MPEESNNTQAPQIIRLLFGIGSTVAIISFFLKCLSTEKYFLILGVIITVSPFLLPADWVPTNKELEDSLKEIFTSVAKILSARGTFAPLSPNTLSAEDMKASQTSPAPKLPIINQDEPITPPTKKL